MRPKLATDPNQTARPLPRTSTNQRIRLQRLLQQILVRDQHKTDELELDQRLIDLSA